MSTSRIAAVIDALFSTLKSAVPTAQVYDGPWTARPNKDFITVGWVPDSEVEPTGEQDWAGLGAKQRNERLDIPGYVGSFRGPIALATRRQQAVALLAAVENALRSDPRLGGAVPEPGWAAIESYSLRQRRTEKGPAVGIEFHVTVKTRV